MPLRVGIVNYLNSRPLAWSFLRGTAGDDIVASFLPPARVADLLAQAELDVGLIPSIEVQRIPGLTLVPDLCVAATREVRSVLLLSRCPPNEIQRLALDENSRTSAALVRILLQQLYGVMPESFSASPQLETMMRQAEAALLIGDPALRVDRRAHRVYDLAAEWRSLTGRPFVFAVWAVRDGVELGQNAEVFEHSLQRGLSEIEAIVEQASRELELMPDEVREYLAECLSFRLGDAEQQGLEEFYRRAHAHGLIPPPQPLRFHGR